MKIRATIVEAGLSGFASAIIELSRRIGDIVNATPPVNGSHRREAFRSPNAQTITPNSEDQATAPGTAVSSD